MPFRARNAYYLRISEKDVLPLYLYLDERHLEWMSDIILQHVISDLRPKILEKLRAESDMKSSSGNANVRGTIETHRGENYQFCYFLRKTEPHSVVIKTRIFKTAPVRTKAGVLHPMTPSSTNEPKRKKRKAPSHPEAENEDVDMDRNKRRRPQLRNRVSTVQKVAEAMDVDDVNPQAQDDDYQPSSSSSDDLIPTNKFKKKGNTRKPSSRRHESDEDESVGEDVQPPMDLAVEEEEKPKPVLDLKYRGFDLFGRCLCVVVEPWPHFQYTMTGRQASLAPIFQRSSLIPAPNLSGEGIAGPSKLGARAPLFLPDDDDDPSVPTSREPQPHPLFGGMVSFDDDEIDDGGMMAFSQVLNNTGDYRSGAADDDDGVEEVFFGDADEHREI